MRLSRIYAAVLFVSVSGVQAQQPDMTFFVTSVAKAMVLISVAWRALMRIAMRSPSSRLEARELASVLEHDIAGGDAGVNARDRIGKGPWQNARAWWWRRA